VTAVALVLGRPPSAASVLHDVVAGLRRSGVEATVDVVRGEDVPDRVRSADVRLLKDLAPGALRALAGLTCTPSPEAVLRSLDKAAVVERLGTAGVPVPATRVVTDWDDVRAAAVAGPLVVKPRSGSGGTGVLLLDGPAPAAAAGPGPWLVQGRVAGDGVDRKLYVAGEVVTGLLRSWPVPAGAWGEPFDVPADLRALALRAAAALELPLAGVDVLLSPDGPVVVDVNAVPGFKGVPDAAALLVAHLRSALADREVAACAP
jgi:ribosomal protein S6--L-glutamate ligase